MPDGELPSLRMQQLITAQDRILKGFAECLEAEEVDEVTTDDLAKKSGVSVRTIYRHFPTRADLLAAASNWINDHIFSYISHNTIEDLPNTIKEIFQRFDERPQLAYAIARGRLGRDIRAGFRLLILTQNRKELEAIAGNLQEQEIRRAEAAIAYLDNVLAWSAMREEFGFTGQESAETVQWVLSLIMKDLKDRNDSINPNSKAKGYGH